MASIPAGVRRLPGRAISTASRLSAVSTLLNEAERLCSCSAAKVAEYFKTHRYSSPCTSNFSAAACTPGWALLQAGNPSTGRWRNSAGAWFQGSAEIQPNPASFSKTVLASAAVPLSKTKVTVSGGNRMASEQALDALQGHGEFLGVSDVAGINVMAQGQTGFPIEHIAQAHLAKIVPALLVMAALRHRDCGCWWWQ